jgi:hypothetical protein
MKILRKEPGIIVLSETSTNALIIGAIFWILFIGACFGDISPKDGQELIFYGILLAFPFLGLIFIFHIYKTITLTINLHLQHVTKDTKRLLRSPTQEITQFAPRAVEVLTSRLRSDTGKTEQRITDICLIDAQNARLQLNTQSLPLKQAHDIAEAISSTLSIQKLDSAPTELRDLLHGAREALTTLARSTSTTLFTDHNTKQ